MSQHKTSSFVAVAIFLTAPALFAEPAPPVRGVPVDESHLTTYRFDDDPLTAGNLPPGETIHAERRAARETVLRPRVSFVGALLRSGSDVSGPYPPPVRMAVRRYSSRHLGGRAGYP